MNSGIFLFTERSLDESTGLIGMSASGAHITAKIFRQLICLNFLDSAPYGYLEAVRKLIVDHADIHSVHLKKKVTYKT